MTTTTTRIVCILLLLLTTTSVIQAFQSPLVRTTTTTRTQSLAASDKNNSNSNKEEEAPLEYSDFDNDDVSTSASSSSVDWDAEWKKVVDNRDQPVQRPGQDFYKSEAELTAIRTANQVREKTIQNIASASSKVRPVLDGSDWKLWVGLLAIVSVGLSLLTSSGGGGADMISSETVYI